MATEKRLIDANALMGAIEFDYDLDYGEILTNPRRFAEMVEDAATVDAVEVVRCEKCVHSLSDGWICGGPSFTMPSHPTYPDAFCSYGERRNNE